MSSLTECNFCTLRSLKERYGADNLTIKKARDGWIEVRTKEGDKFLASFMELGDRCEC